MRRSLCKRHGPMKSPVFAVYLLALYCFCCCSCEALLRDEEGTVLLGRGVRDLKGKKHKKGRTCKVELDDFFVIVVKYQGLTLGREQELEADFPIYSDIIEDCNPDAILFDPGDKLIGEETKKCKSKLRKGKKSSKFSKRKRRKSKSSKGSKSSKRFTHSNPSKKREQRKRPKSRTRRRHKRKRLNRKRLNRKRLNRKRRKRKKHKPMMNKRLSRILTSFKKKILQWKRKQVQLRKKGKVPQCPKNCSGK